MSLAGQGTWASPDQSLRALLSRRGSYPDIAAAMASGRVLLFDVRLFEHIGGVYGRVELAGGDDVAGIAALRLAALLHEEPPESLPPLLHSANLVDCAPTVVAVISAFGRLWKATTDADVEGFVATYRSHLASILLFELAHEGRAIPQMTRAAERGGLHAAFACWTGRLAGATPTPVP